MTTIAPPAAAAASYAAFALLVEKLQKSDWPADVGLVRRWYEPHLARVHDDNPARFLDLEQLERIASTYPSRERFLTELTLDPPEATSENAGAPLLDDDYLILSTIHSAKGQEWKAVYILNVVDGCIPSDLATGTSEEIEEERRLLYVGMTRARDRLELVVPQRFYLTQQSSKGDRHVLAARTRFIPSALLSNFESRIWPQAPDDALPHNAPAPQSIDLGQRLRGRFSRG
jgi:DNA helicase-2/ATP-dependent DNA helicase PcrA